MRNYRHNAGNVVTDAAGKHPAQPGVQQTFHTCMLNQLIMSGFDHDRMVTSEALANRLYQLWLRAEDVDVVEILIIEGEATADEARVMQDARNTRFQLIDDGGQSVHHAGQTTRLAF